MSSLQEQGGTPRFEIRHEEVGVSEHVYRVTEVVGSSPDGFDAAIRNATARASETLRHLDWFEVTELRGNFKDQRVAYFQVTMKVGFRLDDTVES